MTGIALIGCGKWGINYLRTLQNITEAELLYVCDSDQSKINELAALYPEINMVDDYHSVLGDSRVHGVIIATPPNTHYQLAMDSLKSGKAVLVEKPLADSYNSAKKLAAMAEQSGQILMVGHLMQYHPGVELIKKYYDQGILGELKFLNFIRTNCQIYRTDVNVLADLAVHDLSVLLYLLGEQPQWVHAVGTKWKPNLPLGSVVIVMGFASGLLAHVHSNWHYPIKQRRISVIGDQKLVEFDDGKTIPYSVALIDTTGEKTYVKPDLTQPLHQQCKHFIQCINTGTSPRSDSKSALRVMKLLEAVECSIATQTTVKCKG